MTRWARWFDVWGTLLFCVLILGLSIIVLPLTVAAGRNEGTLGTFTAVEKNDTRYEDDWRGEFDSDDGSIHREDAFFDSDDLKRPGDQARAQKVEGDESLYSPNDRSWLLVALADVGCVVYIAWWVRTRRWRRSRTEDADGAIDPETLPSATDPSRRDRARLRDVVWFETLDDKEDRSAGDDRLPRAWAYLYLGSLVLFPVALGLGLYALLHDAPLWPWVGLVLVVEFAPQVMVLFACEDQGRRSPSLFAFRAWLLLHLGGAVPQALRAIRMNRRAQARRQGVAAVPPEYASGPERHVVARRRDQRDQGW